MPYCNQYQLGTEVTFYAAECTEPYANLSGLLYVWEFWDGSTATTTVPHYTKVLTRAGTVSMTVYAVDPDTGSYTQDSYSFDVNSPPVVSSLSASATDRPVPFSTVITVDAEDPEGSPILYKWKLDGADLHQYGNSVNLTFTQAGNYEVTAVLDDDFGGVAESSIRIIARQNIPPDLTPISVTPSTFRRGVGQTATFVTIGTDPDGPESSLVFAWASTPSTLLASIIQSSETPSGSGIQSLREVDLSSVPEGNYIVKCSVTDVYGSTRIVSSTVNVQFNNPPVIQNAGATAIGGGVIRFSALATDADLDLIFYRWDFAADAYIGAFSLYGSAVDYQTVSGQTSVTALLTVTDALGKSVTRTVTGMI